MGTPRGRWLPGEPRERWGTRPRRSLPPGPSRVLSAPGSLGHTHPLRASPSPEVGGERRLHRPPGAWRCLSPMCQRPDTGRRAITACGRGQSSRSGTETEAPALSPRALGPPSWGLDPMCEPHAEQRWGAEGLAHREGRRRAQVTHEIGGVSPLSRLPEGLNVRPEVSPPWDPGPDRPPRAKLPTCH